MVTKIKMSILCCLWVATCNPDSGFIYNSDFPKDKAAVQSWKLIYTTPLLKLVLISARIRSPQIPKIQHSLQKSLTLIFQSSFGPAFSSCVQNVPLMLLKSATARSTQQLATSRTKQEASSHLWTSSTSGSNKLSV